MYRFRLPRKVKKRLLKTLFMYKHDQGSMGFIMAMPSIKEEDYIAYKQGKLTSIMNLNIELDLKQLKANEINLNDIETL